MVINIKDDISALLAIRLVERVLMEGKVCGCGKHYKYFSQFNVNGEELMVSAKTYDKDLVFEVYKGENLIECE